MAALQTLDTLQELDAHLDDVWARIVEERDARAARRLVPPLNMPGSAIRARPIITDSTIGNSFTYLAISVSSLSRHAGRCSYIL